MPTLPSRRPTRDQARAAADLRVTSRNARFQQWQALLTNRTKRQRSGEFVVQGVRPITLALRYGWQIRALLYDSDAHLSAWARGVIDAVDSTTVAVSGALMRELGGKTDTSPEILAVVAMPVDNLARIATSPAMFAVVFDRPTSPGNIGTLVRSADAFGASGVIVTGHAADTYDPKAVRASTGSLFSIPVVRAASPRPVLDWVAAVRTEGVDLRLVASDENATLDAADHDFAGPTLILVGNETTGLSSAWRDACDVTIRIPMTGSASSEERGASADRPELLSGAASSLNAATAASIILYEATRQRRS